MYLQLRDFQEGRREDPAMQALVKDLTRDELHELSNHFVRQKPRPLDFKVDPEKARLGKLKSEETLCTMCQLGGFAGQNEIPKVAGQHHDFVFKQLLDFKSRKRSNDAGNMSSVSRTLNERDIENLGH